MKPSIKHAIRALLSAAFLGSAPTHAQNAGVPIMVPGIGVTGADGRMFGHLPYAEAPSYDMVPVTSPGFALGGTCRMQRDAAADLTALIEAANMVPAIAHRLRGVSCYRTVAYQRSVFCRARDSCGDVAARSRDVGPPGYSEHSTGYAIDFGVHPSPGCPDLQWCMASTPAGLWLIAHARDFGFELSFPANNKQGVGWEPWHWRWVGRTAQSPGAARARMIFARARTQFPARPGIAGPVIQTSHAKPSPRVLPIPIVWPGVYF
ncbi:MAG: M15 family metallopeptidase [Sphingomonas sp.]|uniref:M15 family metallopeptidase n=1 Tax=Sphingomonas sp. TaxID=28214 RepID=UPI003568BAB5